MLILKKDDYVEGIEIIGNNQKQAMCGWVDRVSYDANGFAQVSIQCDDEWMGNRGNILFEREGNIKLLTKKTRPFFHMNLEFRMERTDAQMEY